MIQSNIVLSLAYQGKLEKVQLVDCKMCETGSTSSQHYLNTISTWVALTHADRNKVKSVQTHAWSINQDLTGMDDWVRIKVNMLDSEVPIPK